ncbi:hypothetical protein O181_092883 [Austropuccinia psidii MF-1]|uniref:Uncharacterized protein n=1 Tax=Austropuccinia psidii MF-1 TaxID=1389203 RepID=A0A9Q3J070_9BASI|nr:hypothetical protein [Austropuccinia psidii MF-1]
MAPSQHSSDPAYHPYTRIVPAQHASDTPECPPNMPLTLLTILTLAVPSRHDSDAAYHPYACSALLTCLQRPPHTGLILKAAYDPYTTAAPSR